MDDIRSELIRFIGNEFNENGIPNSIVEPTVLVEGEQPPAQMLVEFATDAAGRTPTAHVLFMPIVENPLAVQYMVFLDYEVEAGAAGDLARFIALLNSNITITGFEYSESLGQIVFRHTQAVGNSPVDPTVIAWTVMMIRYAVDNFGMLVEHVAKGGSYDSAAELLQTSLRLLAEQPAATD